MGSAWSGAFASRKVAAEPGVSAFRPPEVGRYVQRVADSSASASGTLASEHRAITKRRQ